MRSFLKSDRVNSFHKNYGLAIYMILFFCLDIINFIVDEREGLNTNNSISIFGKAFVEIIFIIYLISNLSLYKKPLKQVAYFCIPVLLWLLIYSFKGDYVDWSIVVQTVKELNKYFFAIIIFLVIKGYVFDVKSTEKILVIIYILCSILVIGSALIDCSVFYTYNKDRFGFKPPFAAQNEITFFWMIGITYFGYILKREPSKSNLIYLVLVSISAGLLGTKAIILFITCFLIYLVFIEFKLKIWYKLYLITLFVAAVVYFLYVSNIYNYFVDLYNESGFWDAITSKRYSLIEERYFPIIDNWEWYNFIIGGTYIKMPVVEMDIIDLYLFAGIWGIWMYAFIMKNTIFSFLINNKLGVFFITQFILIGALAGHIFSSGVNAIYLAVLCYRLQN